MIAHSQSVEIQRRFVFDDEGGVSEAREIIDRAVVDGGRVRVRVGGQLELGSRDAQETEWVVVGQRSRFVGVDDVVGDRGDA